VSQLCLSPVKFVVGALRRLGAWTWTWAQVQVGDALDRLHIRVHLWWVSRWSRRLLVVAGARCPLTKPAVTAVELQATTEPHHCSRHGRGVQPGGIFACVVHREPTHPRKPGAGLAPGPQVPCEVPPALLGREAPTGAPLAVGPTGAGPDVLPHLAAVLIAY
jgi:hypothetical protein